MIQQRMFYNNYLSLNVLTFSRNLFNEQINRFDFLYLPIIFLQLQVIIDREDALYSKVSSTIIIFYLNVLTITFFRNIFNKQINRFDFLYLFLTREDA